jgi:hypothetical protein
MSVGVVRDDGRFRLVFGSGRQLRTPDGKPVAWLSDYAQSAGSGWAELTEKADVTGLQPFRPGFLRRMPFESGPPSGDSRPWDSGEVGYDPVDPGDVDALDPGTWLAERWHRPGEEELAADEQYREVITRMLAPFGAQFPGLAPATTAEIDPELRRRALHQYTRLARVGLVPAGRQGRWRKRCRSPLSTWCSATRPTPGATTSATSPPRSWTIPSGTSGGTDRPQLLKARPRNARRAPAFGSYASRGTTGPHSSSSSSATSSRLATSEVYSSPVAASCSSSLASTAGMANDEVSASRRA